MNFRFSGALRATFLAAAVVAADASQAAGISADPGDYVGVPPGTNAALAYYRHLTADEVYSNGNKVASNLGLTLDVAMAKYVRYTNLFGTWGQVLAVVPYLDERIDSVPLKLSGTGNLILGAGIFPIHDLKNNEHLSFTALIQPPTGAHRRDGLNADRWAYNLQAGYIRSLAPAWSVDANAQVEFYGDDKTTRASKNAYFQIDGSVSYHLSAATRVAGTLRVGTGGEDRLNGARLGSEKRNTFVATWASFLDRQWQLQLQYTQDFSVEDGAKLKGVQTRLLYVF